MAGFIVAFVVGVLCVAIGISNRRGNISTLHEYHRHRVSEEDRIPFGKQVGLGTIIIGIAIMVFSGLSVVTLYTDKPAFMFAGIGILMAGLVVGLILSCYAMIKYNRGIF